MSKYEFSVGDDRWLSYKGALPKNNRNHAALEASIAKWEAVVAHIEETGRYVFNGGARTCALCRLYLKRRCAKCPVKIKTGKIVCYGTPYTRYYKAPDNALKHARAEVKFLRSLLKEAK